MHMDRGPVEAECWHCGETVNLDKYQICPYCSVQLPRFVFKIRLCDATQTPPTAHPDPLKRLEGEMAERFREFLIKEFTMPHDELLSTSESSQPPITPIPPTPRIDTLPPGTSLAGMIHHVYIIDARDKFVVNEEFWKIPVDETWIAYFAKRIKDAQDTLIEEFNGTKLIGKPLGRGLVILSADNEAEDDTLREKLDRVTYEFHRVISYEVAYDDFIKKVDDYVTTTLKVSIIGYEGTGKTDIVTLLNGGVPPTTYVPTISIDIQKIEGARIGTLEISTWDFSGQDRFRKLWELYFRGSRIIIIVTDSTLENVLNSKDIVQLIHRKDIAAGLLAIAYKQEQLDALSPKLVERFLGIKAIGLTETQVKSGDPAIALKILGEALNVATPKEEPAPKLEWVFD
ncbi:MAG: ADP-ribosylation factor-like protein [Promethearchaeota archaeon]